MNKGIVWKVAGTLALAAAGALSGAVVQRYLASLDAQPRLVVERVVAGDGYVDLIVHNESSRPVAVYGYLFKPLKLLRAADASAETLDPRGPQQWRWWRQMERGPRRVQTRIDRDDVVIAPPALEVGNWNEGELDPFQIDAYDRGRVRVSVVKPDQAGARYEVQVVIGYGNPGQPTPVESPAFEIDIVDSKPAAEEN